MKKILREYRTDRRRQFCAVSVRSAERSDRAVCTRCLCGIALSFLTALMFAVLICIPAAAADTPAAYIIDIADVFTGSEESEIADRAAAAVSETGFSIVIASTDNIGSPKTDGRTVEYADDLYEEYCGINTDGILLLINCDTQYDYISTSGVCINYFSDRRIDKIFDRIWDDLVAENYTAAAYGFIDRVEYFYSEGKDNHQQEMFGREVDIFDLTSSFIRVFFFTGFVALIVSVSIYAFFSSQYKLEKPSTINYMLRDSLHFDQKSDVFVGNITTRIYSPRSSSSGGHSSGGSHHSSTHHSHSGGRHGGGGRHR